MIASTPRSLASIAAASPAGPPPITIGSVSFIKSAKSAPLTKSSSIKSSLIRSAYSIKSASPIRSIFLIKPASRISITFQN